MHYKIYKYQNRLHAIMSADLPAAAPAPAAGAPAAGVDAPGVLAVLPPVAPASTTPPPAATATADGGAERVSSQARGSGAPDAGAAANGAGAAADAAGGDTAAAHRLPPAAPPPLPPVAGGGGGTGGSGGGGAGGTPMPTPLAVAAAAVVAARLGELALMAPGTVLEIGTFAAMTELAAGNAPEAAAASLTVLRADPSFLPAILLLLFAARSDPGVVVVPRARLFDDELLDLGARGLGDVHNRVG